MASGEVGRRDDGFGAIAELVEVAVSRAVSAALEDQKDLVTTAERSIHTLNLEHHDDHARLAAQVKRARTLAAALVAVVTAASGAGAYVYAQGAAAEAKEAHEAAQDEAIRDSTEALKAHQRYADRAFKEQATKIRNLGALQIEQGNDQRAILIDSAPKQVRSQHAKKPSALVEAEGRVLRD